MAGTDDGGPSRAGPEGVSPAPMVADQGVMAYASATLEVAESARETAEEAYTSAFDEFTVVERKYRKFVGDPGPVEGVKDLVRKFGPTALKFFGAGGAGAGLLLALSKDGTGAGILSRIGGFFGLGG